MHVFLTGFLPALDTVYSMCSASFMRLSVKNSQVVYLSSHFVPTVLLIVDPVTLLVITLVGHSSGRSLHSCCCSKWFFLLLLIISLVVVPSFRSSAPNLRLGMI